jgi:hypothetical protein
MGWVVSITPRPRFAPGERTPGTHWIGGWVGPRAGLDAEARRKILCLCQGSNPGRLVRSQTLYWLSYPGSRLFCMSVEGETAEIRAALTATSVSLIGGPRYESSRGYPEVRRCFHKFLRENAEFLIKETTTASFRIIWKFTILLTIRRKAE